MQRLASIRIHNNGMPGTMYTPNSGYFVSSGIQNLDNNVDDDAISARDVEHVERYGRSPFANRLSVAG
uniref:Pectate lyase n=1 Tax=Steinernema glaseri TaxID=37863 RepID=A0A1I7YYQ3_9BILA